MTSSLVTKNHLEEILKELDVGIVTIKALNYKDPETFTLTFANKVADSALGIPLQPEINKPLLEFVPHLLQTGIFDSFAQVLQTGKRVEIGEFPYFYDGIAGIFQLVAVPIDQHNFFVSFSNITVQKETENALLRNQQLLKEAQVLAKMGNWHLEVETDNLIWSDNLYELFGYKPGEIPINVNSYFDKVHAEDVSLLRTQLENAMATGEGFESIHRIMNKNGRLIFIQSRSVAHQDESGKVIALSGTAQDITEVKDAEAILLESEQRFRAVAQTALEAIVSCDESGIIVFWNQHATTIFGYEAEEIIGKPVKTLMPQAYKEAHQTRLDSLIQGGENLVAGSGRAEMHGLRKNGEVFPIEYSVAKWENSAGVPFYTAVMRDITERRIASEQIKQYNHQLEVSNRALQDFAYVASHDLQEPLRKILAFGGRLTQFEDELGEKGLDYLHRIQNAASRMQTLINDLLTLSRVTTKAEPKNQVDLALILTYVLSDMETTLEETGGKVRYGDLPIIDADPIQMRQLFQNIIANSLKFAHKKVPPRVTISSSLSVNKESPTTVEIRISDNGIGFQEKYLEKIFAPFQRLHPRQKYEGSGMGLAICQKIVERHGGTITAESELNAGTTFIITLPLAQPTGIINHE